MPALVLLGALIGWSSPSKAYVQQIIIDQTNTANYNPIPLGSSIPGGPVSYTIYTGRIIGALSPTNPLNAVITDINLAPTNGGLVNYTSVFSIVTPTNPAARSGLMIHEVPNRGNNAINTNALIAGATYVQSGWQPDLLAQCSTAPVPPYPCVGLSAPYGTPSATYPFFTPPRAWLPSSSRCRSQPSTAIRRTGPTPSPARFTGTYAPARPAVRWRQGVPRRAHRTWPFRHRPSCPISRSARTRTRRSCGALRPRASPA
jgi:hypothetical protein